MSVCEQWVFAVVCECCVLMSRFLLRSHSSPPLPPPPFSSSIFALILRASCPSSRSHPSPCDPQVDSMDNFTPSNTPSREDDPKSHLKNRSRSPSMASDMEPIEVRSLHLPHSVDTKLYFQKFPASGIPLFLAVCYCLW